jgi:diguanylate cyclase (GGDEF)-like protein
MAANDHLRSTAPPPGGVEWLSASALQARLAEEINRAERHGTELSCLLVVIENLDEMAHEHGEELREQTLVYIADALQRELRAFDRVGRPSERELLLVLPGADGARGEIVARRVLERLRTIKVEAGGMRRPLQVSVGLAPWRDGASGEDLLARMRAASQPRNGNGEEPPVAPAAPAIHGHGPLPQSTHGPSR